jgi:hypothetical protein
MHSHPEVGNLLKAESATSRRGQARGAAGRSAIALTVDRAALLHGLFERNGAMQAGRAGRKNMVDIQDES